MKQLMLNTPFVKIFETSDSFEVEINCKDGSVIGHEPFPNTLQGRVNALQLATEICAGKFYLAKVLSVPQQTNLIEINKKGKLV